MRSRIVHVLASAIVALTACPSWAAEPYPTPKQGDFVVRDFHFHSGEVFPELRLHYVTVGDPGGEPVVILHGTAGSGASMLTPPFAGQLFGPGQPLDAATHYVIMPDSIGAGQSAKPSDGMRAKFPRYNYDDMVAAQYRLLTEGLGVRHVRAIIGNSMGGMLAWVWGEAHPDYMDALVPMASQPTAMSSRNWMMRRMVIDAVRNDPEWKGGDYTTQPSAIRIANVYFGIATNGGSLAYGEMAPTRETADKLLDERLAQPFTTDANDYMYQWDASRDYDAAPALSTIKAPVLAINSADDERNPPESGIMERELKRLPDGRLYLIPASAETRGHGTTGLARFWAQQAGAFLKDLPRRPAKETRLQAATTK